MGPAAGLANVPLRGLAKDAYLVLVLARLELVTGVAEEVELTVHAVFGIVIAVIADFIFKIFHTLGQRSFLPIKTVSLFLQIHYMRGRFAVKRMYAGEVR
eukprot:CAMPEP_0196183212 /NCGR_PEP_ID=MMETSP0911-20130528/31226_1 /TAXON_ID=49265 /ORGANISM="Thalassiosira rotula, Strain GSO102" /LENGTH=99 /DNA_ID=CAMNT_0041453087 /DNA_START=190 /DNA_END=486 /DNA_ORIENTATION=-